MFRPFAARVLSCLRLRATHHPAERGGIMERVRRQDSRKERRETRSERIREKGKARPLGDNRKRRKAESILTLPMVIMGSAPCTRSPAAVRPSRHHRRDRRASSKYTRSPPRCYRCRRHAGQRFRYQTPHSLLRCCRWLRRAG